LVVVFAVVSVVCSVVLELIGAGVSTITGAGAGVSTTTGAGVGELVTTVVSVVELAIVVSLFGMRLTFVLVPMPEPLPAPPAELLVYARPLLSTAAGPEITAGVDELPTPAVLFGSCIAIAAHFRMQKI
jgi:hypothetical protein